MNIFVRELKANLKSLLIWGGIVILFVSIGIAKFSAYEGNPEMLAILDQMPPALLEAFNFDAFNLTTITGFLGVMFIYFALLLSISAAMWGSDIISKEERDRTVEFSLTLPIPRGRHGRVNTFAAADDCVGLLIGGRERYYGEQCNVPGTFFMIPGWTYHWRRMFEQQLGKMSPEILEEMFKYYERSLMVTTPTMSLEEMKRNCDEFNEKFGFRTEICKGTLDILHEIWNQAKTFMLSKMDPYS